jgi:hypothetical protein
VGGRTGGDRGPGNTRGRPIVGPDLVPDCPYPGLAPFGSEQARWFFGRRREVAELLGRLGDRGPLVVVGPSGVGKSSLLRAGLVPALAEGRLPGASAVVCTPTANPLDELARTMRDGVVLIVDQFEETFTLCADEDERREFIRTLCAAQSALIVLGLRADFYRHCLDYPELVRTLRRGHLPLGAMSAAELRDAIEQPARVVGMALEPGLADVLLGDLGADDSGYPPGALPLLSHALLATWQQREGRLLTLAGYRLTGGIRGAIAATAERAYLGLDDAGRQSARHLLLGMIQVGDGTDDTRRRLDRNRLVAELTDPDLAERTLDVLADARLVTVDTEVAEIAHEALPRAWPRLRAWLDNDRARLLARQRLADAARAWDSDGRDPSGLHQGQRLAASREWLDPEDEDLSALAREFLARSILGEHDGQRARRRRRRVLIVLGVLLVVTAVVAVQARFATLQERYRATSKRVAAEAAALRGDNADLAAQLSLAAFRLSPTAEARGSLISTYPNPKPIDTGDAVRSVVFSSTGRLLAAASQDHKVWLLDTSDPTRPRLVARIEGHQNEVRRVAFSPDDSTLATASRDRTVRLWNITEPTAPRLLATLEQHADTVYAVAYSARGDLLATGGGDDMVGLWAIRDPAKPVLLAWLKHGGDVYGLAFSPDGRTLVAAAQDNVAQLWDLADPRDPTKAGSLDRHTGAVTAVAFSPDGATLATASMDRTARLWQVRDRTQVAVLTDHTAPLHGVSFSRDGKLVATASVDTTIRLWNVADPRAPVAWASPVVGHADNAYSAAFSPDGRTVASGGHDTDIRLWNIDIDQVSARVCADPTPITRDEWDRYLPEVGYAPPCG